MGGWDLKCTGVVQKMLCTNITYFHTLYNKTSRDKLSMQSMNFLGTLEYVYVIVMAFLKIWISKFGL